MTLIEMSVSLAIISILLVAIGSSIIIAGRAMPDNQGNSGSAVKASCTLEQIASELQYALSFTEWSAHAVEFTVPDRDGDEAAETIRYAWSGVGAEPLTRQYNGGAVVNFMEDVYGFDLHRDVRTVTEPGSTEQEGEEQLLIRHDDSGGAAEHCVVEFDKWPGQYFRPALPPEAVGWRVTRVKFKAKVWGLPEGSGLVQIRIADGSTLPTHTVLGQVPLLESSLGNDYLWQEFAFPAAPKLAPSTGACLVLVHVEGLSACSVRLETGGANTPDAHYVRSLDRDVSWSADTSRDMLFYVYGTVIGTDSSTASSRYYVTGVRLSLQVGTDAAACVQTAVRTLNEHEVTAP